jgi:NO-binding membrane sensor protein with MHYT domain
MGLTQKLGTIPLAVFTDSSNNVGIGAAAMHPTGILALAVKAIQELKAEIDELKAK